MKATTRSIFRAILTDFAYLWGTAIVGVPVYLLSKSYSLGYGMGTVAFAIPFLYILFRKTGIDSGLRLSRRPSADSGTRFPFLTLLGIGILLAVVGQVYAWLFNPFPYGAKISLGTAAEEALIGIWAVFLVPVAEELLHRQWMISYLERAQVKPVYILALTSLLFFMGHTQVSPLFFRFDALFYGVVLYFVYMKYRDVKCCIFVHIILNLLSYGIHIFITYL
ncbi:MAG: CPBP family intramembrane metalloprotease [Bacteroidaceae bacterium]|nr:CPBP family intramembrane metalloprotease [Bacteroidaceae bacterium]